MGVKEKIGIGDTIWSHVYADELLKNVPSEPGKYVIDKKLPTYWWSNTTLCDKVCQWFAAGRWLWLVTPVFPANKTDPHDVTEKLLKVALTRFLNPLK